MSLLQQAHVWVLPPVKNHLFPAFTSTFDIYSFQQFLDLKKKKKELVLVVVVGRISGSSFEFLTKLKCAVLPHCTQQIYIFLKADSLISGAVMESV